jgi:hypothetical protein
MGYGLCLPNFPDGASREGMEAAAETVERLCWSTVWTVNDLALWFRVTNAPEISALAERFARDVAPLV